MFYIPLIFCLISEKFPSKRVVVSTFPEFENKGHLICGSILVGIVIRSHFLLFLLLLHYLQGTLISSL